MAKRPDANDILRSQGHEGARRAIAEAVPVEEAPSSEKTRHNGKARSSGDDDWNEEAYQAEIQRLSKLSKARYEQQRTAAATAFEIRVVFLDREVKAAREAQEQTIEVVPDIEPWPDPVDGARLLDEIAAAMLRHIRVPTRAERAIALYVLFTYCLEAMDLCPRLAITSPMRGCGKTTLMKLLTCLVNRPLPSSKATSAAIYRSIDLWHPTLLIDEMDTFLPKDQELRGILNSGHDRAFAFVLRTAGEGADLTPKRFSTWCPMVFGLIGTLPHTLADRSIHIILQRRKASEPIEPLRLHQEPYRDLAQKAKRWALDHMDALRAADPTAVEDYINREADNWIPLCLIADEVGGLWPEYAREAARTLTPFDVDSQDIKTMLLSDIRDLLGDREAISSKELIKRLVALPLRPWAEYRKGKPITQRALADRLREFKVIPVQTRLTGEKTKSYLRTDLVEAFERYLPPPSP